MQQKTFYQYSKENMNALGLPAPESCLGQQVRPRSPSRQYVVVWKNLALP
jgi:hypothetical protein